jgi:hypothetical protein
LLSKYFLEIKEKEREKIKIKSKININPTPDLALKKYCYQILTTLSSGFLIGSPGLTPKASQNSGMFINGPLTL